MRRTWTRALTTKLAHAAMLTLLVAGVGGGVAVFTSTPTLASSSPNYEISRKYYSTPAKTTQVGYWTCNCQGEENQAWGHQTPYYTEQVTRFCPAF